MSYTALYRKLRPKNFEQVIGQDVIVKTLKHQLESGRITHAYLFCGTRGTGKTSTAKIFAKILNCQNPILQKPCGNCKMCIAIEQNISLNVIEIDAASNNGVDDIREIREEVKYTPPEGKYKVYIIDEVHMLYIGAFNALLKTLEEPPSHVVFILATTDPQKIPITILSRCQRFDFKRISNKIMFDTIKQYMIDENIEIEDEAIKYIVKISDGAMRDALSIIDQTISFFYNQKITLNKVLEITGSVDNSIFLKLIKALIDLNSNDCILIVNSLIENGRDIFQFVMDFIAYIRNIIVVILAKESKEIIDISYENVEEIKQISQKSDIHFFLKIIDSFSAILPDLKNSFNNRIIIEVCCIKICSAIDVNNLNDIFEKIRFLEKKLENNNENKNENVIFTTKNINNSFKDNQIEKKPRKLAINEDFKSIIKNWDKIIKTFSNSIYEILKRVKPNNLEDNVLYLICENSTYLKTLLSKKDVIEQMFSEKFNKQYNILPIDEKDFNLKYKKISLEEKKVNNVEDNINIKKDFDEKINFNNIDIDNY